MLILISLHFQDDDILEFERAKLLVDNVPDNFIRRHFGSYMRCKREKKLQSRRDGILEDANAPQACRKMGINNDMQKKRVQKVDAASAATFLRKVQLRTHRTLQNLGIYGSARC